MGIGMLGRRQVTPRWADDPVWMQDGSRQEIGQGRVRVPPPPDGNQVEGGEGRRRAEKGGEGQSGLRRVRGHCTSLEDHHLIICTHPTYQWSGKQQQPFLMFMW